MGLIEIEAFLKQTVGLNPFSCGAAVIERAVRERMDVSSTSDWKSYYTHLKRSTGELRALAEAVIEPETWFFRDREAFLALRRFAVAHRPEGSARKPLRVLCVPSGRGEEAYSVVMSLLECGLTPGQFVVHAVDLHDTTGAESKAGVFGWEAFRGGDVDMRRRYFQATPDGFTVNRTVREAVNFHPGNLITGTWAGKNGSFDAIFCRRFLSYFSSTAQGKLVRKLRRLLSPRGLLFVAPTEVALLHRHQFDAGRIAVGYADSEPANPVSSDGTHKEELLAARLTSTPRSCLKAGSGQRQSKRGRSALAASVAGNGRA